MLKMKNITKQFPGVRALDQVSLEACDGEVLGLIGINGAGKSEHSGRRLPLRRGRNRD